MYGLVEINGQRYMERFVVLPFSVAMTALLATKGQYVLPGTAKFWLKGLTRETFQAGVPTTDNRFLFKFGNSDGSIWHTAAGVGGTTDLVLDSLMFGSGQFPFVVNPHIVFSETASFNYEITDLSGEIYTIYFALHGSWLFPTEL